MSRCWSKVLFSISQSPGSGLARTSSVTGVKFWVCATASVAHAVSIATAQQVRVNMWKTSPSSLLCPTAGRGQAAAGPTPAKKFPPPHVRPLGPRDGIVPANTNDLEEAQTGFAAATRDAGRCRGGAYRECSLRPQGNLSRASGVDLIIKLLR